MSKLLSNIAFSFFLLFQTISLADEDAQKEHTETNITAEKTETNITADETKEKAEPQDPLSEAQKEAMAAEEAELREAGIAEEPIVE